MKIKIKISVGELLDKLSILMIKKEKINNPEKIKEIEREFKFLESHALTIRSINKLEYDTFLQKLININSKLWDIEDDIRILEKNSSFSDEFVSLARSVYFTNDERFSCKNEINIFYGSEINEVKEYVEYNNNSEN